MSRGRGLFRVSIAGAVAAMLLVVGAGVAEFPQSLAATANACKPAVIAGKHKCLRVGQRCLARYQAAYKKYGFSCVNGRLRRSVTTTAPTTTITVTTSPPLSSQNRVYGGGNFTGPEGASRNFAVDAHADSTGASGDVEYGNASGYAREEVKCLNISGNKATIGAVVAQSPRPDTVGFLVAMVLVDNGTPFSGNRDEATLQFLGPANSPGWPAGFPNTCPAPDAAAAAFGFGYFPLNGGDIVVQAAK